MAELPAPTAVGKCKVTKFTAVSEKNCNVIQCFLPMPDEDMKMEKRMDLLKTYSGRSKRYFDIPRAPTWAHITSRWASSPKMNIAPQVRTL